MQNGLLFGSRRSPLGGRWLAGSAWVAVLALSALLAANLVPYFSLRADFAFLEEKGELASSPWWRGAFYLHISGGLICLATAPVLLWNGLRRRAVALHRGIGAVYAVAVLGLAGPAGLCLSLYAKGGLPGRGCFLILGALWWFATARGLLAVRTHRIHEHRRWMMRSYALALSAVFFRIFHVALYLAGLGDEENYIASLWLSLAASLCIGEGLADRTRLSEGGSS